MRYLTVFVVSAAVLMSEFVFASLSAPAIAQTQTSAQEKAASLRAQLAEVETKQAELQTHLQKLDEDLKPENIEHSLAGVGSTRPEEERAQRRRQLEIERNGVQAQINLLATSHTRLETAIAQADVEAYRQSAAPVIVVSTETATTTTASPASVESSTATTTTKRHRRGRRRPARAGRH